MIEVHRCCCPGGLLGGLRAGRGGLGHVLFQLCMRSWSMGRRLATSMVGAIWKKDFEVERFDLPPLRGGHRRGKLFIVRSLKLLEIP